MKARFTLENKNILITGASSGIGLETAKACKSLGANLALIGRNQEKLAGLSVELGGETPYYSQDLSETDQLNDLIKDVVGKIGKLDGLVHSAGTEMSLPLKVLKKKHYQQAFDINVIAAFELAKILSNKKFRNEDNCSFVFISSVMSLVGEAIKTAYCASKGALVSGSKAMALELASKNIRVNCISPALVKTAMSEELLNGLSVDEVKKIEQKHPLGFGSPEDVAAPICFLLSDGSQWITGTNLVVDGGYSAQ